MHHDAEGWKGLAGDGRPFYCSDRNPLQSLIDGFIRGTISLDCVFGDDSFSLKESQVITEICVSVSVFALVCSGPHYRGPGAGGVARVSAERYWLMTRSAFNTPIDSLSTHARNNLIS